MTGWHTRTQPQFASFSSRPAGALPLSVGLNVIRGGEGCLRLTPWFHMSAAEARLVQGVVRRVLGRRGLLGRPTP